MRAYNYLLKKADDETIGDEVRDGYYTMAQRGAIPAVLLGTLAAYKSKGLKSRAIHGLAGVGAGYLGTFAGKTGYDMYKHHQRKKAEKEAELMAMAAQ